MLRSGDGIDSPSDEIFSGRRQDLEMLVSLLFKRNRCTDLDPDIIWDLVVFDEASDKIEICIASSGVGDFNLLDAALDELPEEGRLLLNRHRICKGLVSIPEICRQPDGDFCERLGWPLAVWDVERGITLVFLGRIGTTKTSVAFKK